MFRVYRDKSLGPETLDHWQKTFGYDGYVGYTLGLTGILRHVGILFASIRT